jgi:hypothetical protein
MFRAAPAPTQEDIEAIVERASKRILRFLQRRGVITLVTAPGDGEVTAVTDETMGDKDPLLARLLAAVTAGAPPAGPANKRQPIRIVLDPDERPMGKGALCGQRHGFNLHAAARVAANDEQGRLPLRSLGSERTPRRCASRAAPAVRAGWNGMRRSRSK